MMTGASRQSERKAGVLFGLWAVLLISPYGWASGFSLNDQCPPSFALDSNNQCQLRNLYQLYDSLQDQGLGGLKTALPDHRDGFSPQQIDLGRLLFFDPVLSGNKDLSCANCHNPAQGFTDGMARSVGASGQAAIPALLPPCGTALFSSHCCGMHEATVLNSRLWAHCSPR
jgi:cytochrome c peroxidase